VDRDGRLVVTDASQQQILVLDAFLNLAQVLGDPGSHGEQFSDPSGIVFLPDGGFVVADRGNRRLQTYSRLAYFEGIVGGEFDLNNPMITPQGIDCDVHGNLFVADPAANAVHVFSRQWKHLFSMGSDYGLLAGPELPMDVAVGPDDLMAVSDRGREAVLVYRIVYQ
jgi:DNA-binding beta-propeller fold protein YncE